MGRKLNFNAKHFTGVTQYQKDVISGVALCGARWGTRAVAKVECAAPVAWLRQEGRRRWVIDGFCETHGSLTKDLSDREGVYVSWARVSDVLPTAKIAAEVR